MKPAKQNKNRPSFLSISLSEQCDPRHPLRKLGEQIESGRNLKKPLQDITAKKDDLPKRYDSWYSLLILKQMYNASDERVVEHWLENIYWQQFSGVEELQWKLPCDASELTYFRNRIGEKGVGLIFEESVQLHGKKTDQTEVLKTIAVILIRELERKLPASAQQEHKESFALYRKVLSQKQKDTPKIYSLHEPHVYCISKGKEHKKYEFGTKASLAITKNHGVILAAIAHPTNIYDANTLPEVLNQVETISKKRPQLAIVDRGYRGKKMVETTKILIPGKPPKDQSSSESAKIRNRFRRRAAIEPVISHLKYHFRLLRCFLKGFQGDQINLMMAAAAWNFRKWMNQFDFCSQN